jgi:hypothetical protein
MADHWYLENPTKPSLNALRRSLINKCPEFALIRDVADASKHAQLTYSVEPPRAVSSSDQIARSPGFFNAPFGEGVFFEAVEVLVRLEDGTMRPLAGIVQPLLSMWEGLLASSASRPSP